MTFLKWLWDVLETFGKARAASHFARIGNHEAAREMLRDI